MQLQEVVEAEGHLIDSHVMENIFDKVVEHNEGLILLSGGPDGPVNPLFEQNRGDEARAALQAMLDTFGDRFYVELQRHDDSPNGGRKGGAAESGLVEFAYAHDAPLVATNDVQFATRDFYAAHEALLCIADGAYLEIERSMSETLVLLLRADSLYRAGNLPMTSPLAPRAAVFRYTAGGTIALAPGFRLKASGELWAFSNDVPVHQELELAFHLGVVGTF